MSGEEKKCPKCPPQGAADWLLTYGDMVTLLLCFFVLLMNPKQIDGFRIELIMASFQGLGPMTGGRTLEVGEFAELGHTYSALQSSSRQKGLAKAKMTAKSLFQPEVKNQLVKITEDERGLIISLASDAFFRPGSATVDIENTRSLLQKTTSLLTSPDLRDRKFRIEGHTDETASDPDGPWTTNWELSTARATNVLHYLVDMGASEKQFQVSGFSDTVPVDTNETPEGRAANRRVDIVIISEGHF